MAVSIACRVVVFDRINGNLDPRPLLLAADTYARHLRSTTRRVLHVRHWIMVAYLLQ